MNNLLAQLVAWLSRVLTLNGPRSETERLERQTVKEGGKTAELRKVLDAKRRLSEVQADNLRLRKEIDGTNERTVAIRKSAKKGN